MLAWVLVFALVALIAALIGIGDLSAGAVTAVVALVLVFLATAIAAFVLDLLGRWRGV